MYYFPHTSGISDCVCSCSYSRSSSCSSSIVLFLVLLYRSSSYSCSSCFFTYSMFHTHPLLRVPNNLHPLPHGSFTYVSHLASIYFLIRYPKFVPWVFRYLSFSLFPLIFPVRVHFSKSPFLVMFPCNLN